MNEEEKENNKPFMLTQCLCRFDDDIIKFSVIIYNTIY